jgi:hypothetical protein
MSMSLPKSLIFKCWSICAEKNVHRPNGKNFCMRPALRTNLPGSLHSLAIAWSAPGHWLPWGRFLDAMRAGQPQTVAALGAAIWDYFAQQPEEAAAFG